jgi:hypothetical protein
MKKLLLALLAVVFISTVSFAQTSTSKTTAAPTITKTVTGKVDSVTIGNTAKKIKSEIAITDDNGQKLNLVVKSSTTITAKDGQKIGLGQIQKNAKVSVEYKAKTGGTNRAQSIKVIE